MKPVAESVTKTMSNILVVEDDPLTLSSVKDLLEAEDFQVTGAEDGEIALQLLEKNKFDLIVCDLFLPKVNGYEVFSSIKKSIDNSKIPFIVLSGRNKSRDVALGMEIGVSDYITKPFVNEELINSIQAQLKKKQFLEKCYQKLDSDLDETEKNAPLKSPQPKNPLYYNKTTHLANQFCLREHFEHTVSNYAKEKIKLSSSGEKQLTSIAVCCISLSSPENLINDWDQKQIDHILKIASARLNNCLGNKAKIMMLAEGYFTLILPYVTHLTQALNLVKTAQESLLKPFAINNQVFNIKPNVGISFYPQHGQEIEQLLERAKQALLNAHQNLEDCYEVYRPHISYALKYKSLALVEDLRHAIHNNEFKIHYQPQISLLTGKVAVAEASIIWHHPRRGYISPKTFLPIAEDIGLIKSIETWFLFSACQQLKYWQELGFEQLKLATNLSEYLFSQNNLNSILTSIMNQAQINPESLIVELEERFLFHDQQSSLEKICDLKSLGVKIALDNFGTGYSSLSYLQQFPYNILKVDMLHLVNVLRGQNCAIALKYILRVAQKAKIKVTVVNITTPEQLTFLRQHKVELAQGDFLSLRLQPHKFEELLQEGSDWLSTLFSFPPM